MKRSKWWLGFGVLLLVLLGWEVVDREIAVEEEQIQSAQVITAATESNPFWDALPFYPAIHKAETVTGSYETRGVVVPHHLLASEMIAATLAQIATTEIDHIVLITPNHYELGSAAIITTETAWTSPIGAAKPSLARSRDLMALNELIAVEEEAVRQEHAVLAVLPYLTQYFPEATVTSLMLSMKLTSTDLDDLVADLTSLDTPSTLYVASVDFSHYLQVEETRARDELTRALLSEKNYPAIFSLTSEHVDSPRSIIVLMKVMDALGYPRVQILDNQNSTNFIADYTGEITSYFSIILEQ